MDQRRLSSSRNKESYTPKIKLLEYLQHTSLSKRTAFSIIKQIVQYLGSLAAEYRVYFKAITLLNSGRIFFDSENGKVSFMPGIYCWESNEQKSLLSVKRLCQIISKEAADGDDALILDFISKLQTCYNFKALRDLAFSLKSDEKGQQSTNFCCSINTASNDMASKSHEEHPAHHQIQQKSQPETPKDDLHVSVAMDATFETTQLHAILDFARKNLALDPQTKLCEDSLKGTLTSLSKDQKGTGEKSQQKINKRLKTRASVESVSESSLYSLRTRQVYQDDVLEQLRQEGIKLENRVWIVKSDRIYEFEYKKLLVPYIERSKNDTTPSKGHFRNVYQNGVQYELYIGSLHLPEEKGFGVYALENIAKGKAIFEYSGKLMTSAEADRTEKTTGPKYMYDLEQMYDIVSPEEEQKDKNLPRAIDAKEIGNASRFLNHSCSPNLMAKTEVPFLRETFKSYNTFRVVFSSTRKIARGDELTIDYYPHMTAADMEKSKNRALCKCNAANGSCRKWILI